MTLKEKILNKFPFTNTEYIREYEQITDDFAVGFAEWVVKTNAFLDYGYDEALQIYKTEKGILLKRVLYGITAKKQKKTTTFKIVAKMLRTYWQFQYGYLFSKKYCCDNNFIANLSEKEDKYIGTSYKITVHRDFKYICQINNC